MGLATVHERAANFHLQIIAASSAFFLTNKGLTVGLGRDILEPLGS